VIQDKDLKVIQEGAFSRFLLTASIVVLSEFSRKERR